MAEDDGTRRWQRFDTPVDPIQAMRSALAAIRRAPSDLDARRRLHAIGAEHWEQLAVLLADEARAADDPRVAVAFYEELADVRENLDQPIETIAAMEKVVELEPGKADHHDRLAWMYRRSDAWIKAAESYERVGELSPDERGRAALRAAGTLYRERGKLERAAKIYWEIVERRPSDIDAWRALDEILTEQGRWIEAAAARGERAARAKGVEKAALLRSQARALERAGEQGEAAKLVEEAQDHAPDNMSGLVDFADVLAREGKGREAADILEKRIDDAVDRNTSTDDVAALRLRLFEIYDDQLKDRGRAQMVMADLFAAAPDYLPALERLAARAARDPDPRAHADALLRYAAAVPEPLSRGYAVLEAARRYREVGDHAAAIAAFEDAATLVDDPAVRRELADARTASSLQTVLARADELEQAGKLDAAAEKLRAALEDLAKDTLPERHAPIVFQLARVLEKLGDDDSHQLLHEAHRLDRKSLRIQLALGESYFQRKIWRQAALHLGGLADHPDAARHAAAIAKGLVHAAQAEIRALRPQNAQAHYEAAARLDPACGPAWHALGEAALERGEVARAVDCLEREAQATAEPRDRLRLFEALGDLALDVLGDTERAERCWLQIAALADVPVLDKLVTVQRTRGTVRGDTSERLAELVADPAKKKALVEEAATAHAKAGDLGRATTLAERLMAAHARDADALAVASAIALQARDAKRAAQWLERALAAWDHADDRGDGDPQRAELWRRLGDAKRALAAPEAAIAAYRRAVSTCPSSEGAHAARRGLVELAAAAGESAVTSRMALVEAEQDPVDVLAWARELAAAGQHDDARLAFDLARALEAVLDERDYQVIAAHAARAMASDEAYATSLDDAEYRALVDDPEEGPLGQLFELLADAAALLCPAAQTALADADILDATRIGGTSDAPIAAIYPQIAKAFGGPPTLLYTTPKPVHPALALLYATPPVVVFGPGVRPAHLRFELGRIVELSRPRRIFAAQAPEAFDIFVRGLRYAFGPPGQKVERAVIAGGDRLHGVTPVALRRRLTEWFAAFTGELYDPGLQTMYVTAAQRSADRAGLLASGDIVGAVESLGGAEHAPHLIQLAASQKYFAARKKLRPAR
jgi:tetratricopeptide (TPR) repeat protein